MQHELQIIDQKSDSVWADFGYRDQELLMKAKALGLRMLQQGQRDDITTRTQAFKAAIEQDGEKIGLKLDTVNDYFVLGVLFTQATLAMKKTEQHLRRGWVKLPLNLGAVACAGVSAAQLLGGDRTWIGYACMAVLLVVLKMQLARPKLD